MWKGPTRLGLTALCLFVGRRVPNRLPCAGWVWTTQTFPLLLGHVAAASNVCRRIRRAYSCDRQRLARHRAPSSSPPAVAAQRTGQTGDEELQGTAPAGVWCSRLRRHRARAALSGHHEACRRACRPPGLRRRVVAPPAPRVDGPARRMPGGLVFLSWVAPALCGPRPVDGGFHPVVSSPRCSGGPLQAAGGARRSRLPSSENGVHRAPSYRGGGVAQADGGAACGATLRRGGSGGFLPVNEKNQWGLIFTAGSALESSTKAALKTLL